MQKFDATKVRKAVQSLQAKKPLMQKLKDNIFFAKQQSKAFTSFHMHKDDEISQIREEKYNILEQLQQYKTVKDYEKYKKNGKKHSFSKKQRKRISILKTSNPYNYLYQESPDLVLHGTSGIAILTSLLLTDGYLVPPNYLLKLGMQPLTGERGKINIMNYRGVSVCSFERYRATYPSACVSAIMSYINFTVDTYAQRASSEFLTDMINSDVWNSLPQDDNRKVLEELAKIPIKIIGVAEGKYNTGAYHINSERIYSKVKIHAIVVLAKYKNIISELLKELDIAMPVYDYDNMQIEQIVNDHIPRCKSLLEAPKLPKFEAPKSEAPQFAPPQSKLPKAPKFEAPKPPQSEAPKSEAPKFEIKAEGIVKQGGFFGWRQKEYKAYTVTKTKDDVTKEAKSPKKYLVGNDGQVLKEKMVQSWCCDFKKEYVACKNEDVKKLLLARS